MIIHVCGQVKKQQQKTRVQIGIIYLQKAKDIHARRMKRERDKVTDLGKQADICICKSQYLLFENAQNIAYLNLGGSKTITMIMDIIKILKLKSGKCIL